MMSRLTLKYDLVPFLEYVEKTTGMTVPDTNYRTLRDSIGRRLDELNLEAARYLCLIENDMSERERFLNFCTINETYFFRECRHFTLLQRLILPELAALNRSLSFWSVTCSSGEEALSMAMIAEECCAPGVEYRVFASDINTEALRRVEQGSYSDNSLRSDGKSFMPLIEKYTVRSGKVLHIKEFLRSKVIPVHLNVYQGPLDAIPNGIHLALFRNTLIYMKPSVKMDILHAIAAKISPGGYLLLSSAEMPHLNHENMILKELDGVYFFQKMLARRHNAASPVVDGSPADSGTLMNGRAVTRSIDKEAVLSFASRLSEGKAIPEVSDYPSLQMAELLHYVLYFINNLKFDLARQLLSVIDAAFANEITVYLRGFMEMLAGNNDLALSCFRQAIRFNKKFWPARFYLATILKNTGDGGARGEFAACRYDIEADSSRGGSQYRFLLENFSERYFIELCTHWIETLDKK